MDINFKFRGAQIVIATVLTFLSVGMLCQAQEKVSVCGVIVTDEGHPLPGGAVLVAGTTTGVVTDLSGGYTIKAAPSDILVFSAMGYTEIRERVGDRKRIDITMHPEVTTLNDAVVIGYGTVAKGDITGAVGLVNADDINSPAMSSADQALQGRIAGVDIVSGGGEPGAAATIRVRGTRSISAGNDPLIVVDGVADAVESFSDINPDDIKNISVLKDASSTAIYGSRGANGVIIITTKSGETSKTNIVFSASVSLSMLPKKLDVMDAKEFAQWRNDYRLSYSSLNLPQTSLNYAFENPGVFGKGTDWQEVLTQKAVSQTYRLQLSQGNSKQHTYFSVAWDDNDGIVIRTGMKRASALLKIDRQVFKWLTAGARVSYTYRRNDVNKIAINGTSSTSAVSLSPLVGKEDVWNRYSDTADSSSSIFNSPYLKANKETNFKNTHYVNLSPWVEIRPYKGIVLRSTYSFVMNNLSSYFYSPSTLAVAASRKTGGSATRSDTDRIKHMSETTLSWKKTFDKKHRLDLMGGFSVEKSKAEVRSTSGTGYADDNVGYNNLAGLVDKRALTETSSVTEITRLSFLARGTYSYRSRYHATLTARYDGSSNFSAGNKWAFFPAAAFKWTISSEPWMAAARSVGLSDLSLRLSAGRSGNDAISSYVSQAAITSAAGTWLFGDNTQLIAYPSRLGDPTLTWEKTTSYNAGVDVSLLKDRITMSLDAYLSSTKDLLLSVQNAAHTGYTSRYANVGSTKGWGVEYSIDSRNIVKPNFTWRTTFTASHSTSTVTDIGNDYEYVATYSKGTQMVYGYKKGYSANALWGYQYCGVWQNDQQRADNAITKSYVSYSNSNGYSKYADINHDGVLDKNDMLYLGTSDPVLQGSLQNTFKIYNFELGIFFTYSLGGRMYNISEFLLGNGVTSSNKYRYLLDAWHPVRNPDGVLPSAKSTDSYACSRYVHDSSYLRLKTLSLSYRFDLTRKVKWLRDISLGVYCDNLWLLTGYNGFDPDVSSSKAVQRLDDASYPNPRTFTFSVKVRY